MPDFVIGQHDRLPSIAYLLSEERTENGVTTVAPIDLTGTTVRFNMKKDGATAPKVDGAAVVINATQGFVRYDWAALDTDTAGNFTGEWEITDTAGRQRTVPLRPKITIEIVPDNDNA